MYSDFCNADSIVLEWAGDGPLIVQRLSDGSIPVVVVQGQVIVFASAGETFALSTEDRSWEVRYHPGRTLEVRGYDLLVKNAALVICRTV
ncbi:hypothetical protein [Paludisphaera rhizosphaerae]|uniref:hypothetical protein n=1 Tax=Paludisphaera rhizosphaerae TaxID=2711216 RepID=UPI001C6F222D|nr:hypothetical protein [Paludisphaera rhizosphaerae]